MVKKTKLEIHLQQEVNDCYKHFRKYRRRIEMLEKCIEHLLEEISILDNYLENKPTD